jgi:hypothetical protein
MKNEQSGKQTSKPVGNEKKSTQRKLRESKVSQPKLANKRIRQKSEKTQQNEARKLEK